MSVRQIYSKEKDSVIAVEDVEYCCNIDTREVYNIILLERGQLALRIDNQVEILIAPCFVALKENLAVEFCSSYMLDAHFVRFDVSFLNQNISYQLIHSGLYERNGYGWGFPPLNAFYNTSDVHVRLLPLTSEELAQGKMLIQGLESALLDRTYKRWSCRAREYLSLLLELIHQLYSEFTEYATPLYDLKNPYVWISCLLKRIHADYGKNMTLISLSKSIGINKTTVSQRFKAIVGCSVTEYIMQYRIKCACYLLATTSAPINEIANLCGLYNAAYLIKQFKSRKGTTPGKYRKMIVEKRKAEFNEQKTDC